jgi:GTPase SAR1 family protein
MEALAFILIPLAVSLLVKLTAARRHRPAPVTGPANAPPGSPEPDGGYVPPTFRVVALGTSGSGKTVFLSSLFHKLNFRTPGRSYYLETDPKQRIALGSIYGTVSDPAKPWPPGTREGETREFTFDCVGVDDHAKHTVLRFSCLDYAGELLEVEQEPGATGLDDLAERIASAHALLAMIDGHRVLQLLRNERAGHDHFQHSLQPMLGFMQGASCPIHLILTKWDLVREHGEASGLGDEALLEQVIERLLRYEHISALVYIHSRHQIVRLIPVSAVGPSFAKLGSDGKVVKRSDGEMRPTNVEVPLCAILPDLFEQVEQQVDQTVRHAVNAEMVRQLRRNAGAVVGTVLARPAGAALRLVLQGALGRDVGTEASTLFLEWMVRPSANDGRFGQVRDGLERRLVERERLREAVMTDFKKTVLRLEAALPSSELSNRW